MQLDSLIIAYIPSWVLEYGSVLTIEDSHFQQMAKIRAGNIPAFLDIVEYLTGSEEYLNLFDKHMIINIFKFLSQYNPKNQVWSITDLVPMTCIVGHLLLIPYLSN